MDSLRMAYSRLEVALKESRGSESKFKEYENRVVLLTSEVERLRNLLR